MSLHHCNYVVYSWSLLLHLNLSVTLMLYIHLIILISSRWSAILLSFFTSQVCRPCNIQLHIHTHTACVEMTVKSMYITLTTSTTIVLWPFVRDYPGKPVPEETFTHPPSWSSSNLYQLLPCTTIHSNVRVQIACLAIFCTTSLHILFGLPLGVEPSTSYYVHFFTQSVSFFRNTCPYHRSLFCCSIKIV